MSISLSINLTIGIAGLLVGLGLGHLLQRAEKEHIRLPRPFGWLTVQRVVSAGIVLLALSTMLTGVLTTGCQTEYNKRISARTIAISEAQTRVNNALIKATENSLLPDNVPTDTATELRNALLELQEERRNTPVPREPEC